MYLIGSMQRTYVHNQKHIDTCILQKGTHFQLGIYVISKIHKIHCGPTSLKNPLLGSSKQPKCLYNWFCEIYAIKI